jgi:phospholipase/carboxylesterase
MPDATTIARRPDRPTEGFSTAHLPAHPDRPVRLFVPADYQPKYAYPLVVLFHADGADEDTAARLAPQLSRRNYIAACPRGTVSLGSGSTGRPAFGWDSRDPRLDRYALGVVNHTRRQYHIHSERVYFLGVGEGAAVAYRLALAMPDRVAGVVALNGAFPAIRVKASDGLRVFVGHGTSNPVVSLATARRASRLLAATGADVRFQSYPTTHRLHDDMLRDANRWIMGGVNPDPNSPATPNT